MFTFNAKIEDIERLEQTLIGRRNIADWLEKQAMNFARNGQPMRELLIGPRGSGKTHLLRVLYHRIAEQPEVQQDVVIAYMSEDEYGIDTYLDLLLRIFKAFTRLTRSDEMKNKIAEHIEQLKRTAPEQRIPYAERYLLEFLQGRRLLVLIENLNDIFAGIGEDGQSQWRDFIQTHDNTGVVSTSQAIFKDVNNRSKPFFGYFHITYLPKLSFDDALELMQTLASYDQRQDLLEHLKTDEGRGNLRAIYELTEGNHRLLVTFYNFLKTDFKCELSRAFLLTLDKLKPYYESFLKLLPYQLQKIIQYLALQRIPQTGSQIAQNCFLQATTVSKQMSELRRLGYVDVHKEGRDAYYEITEPLLRICIEVNEDHDGIIKLFVDFLGRLYSAPDLKKGFLRYALLQDLVNPELRNNYRDEAKYFGRAIEVYVDGWKLSSEQQEEVLSLKTIEERERLIEEIVRESENFDIKKFMLMIGEGKHDAAENTLRPFSKDEKITYYGWYNLGVVYQRQGNIDRAIIAYQKSIEAKPRCEKAWNNLGVLLLEKKEFEKAENAFQKAMEIKPELSDSMYNLGLLYFERNEFERAEESYKRTIQVNPNSDMAWFNLGILYKRIGLNAEAETAYKKSIELSPTKDQAWNNLGNLYVDQMEFEKAKSAFNKALEISPERPETWFNLGMLYVKTNDLEKAKYAALQSEQLCESGDTWRLLILFANLNDASDYIRIAGMFKMWSKWMKGMSIVPLLAKSNSSTISTVLSDKSFLDKLWEQNQEPLNHLFDFILPRLLHTREVPLEQLATVLPTLTKLYALDASLQYPIKYFALGIRYYREGDKKALYELTKEERKAFFEWMGEDGSE